ncbi:hypothetical protein Y1Q_0014228 [Alligator mississippiensis]|uniref:Uncharacterized protein n=1 Tax=Alligator mississippiensis TaxID=8496 RepID=A0A151MUC1_ALLMI|nr:hypothetical protein Y1Q_0014228 [Alligator mississippiensis]
MGFESQCFVLQADSCLTARSKRNLHSGAQHTPEYQGPASLCIAPWEDCFILFSSQCLHTSPVFQGKLCVQNGFDKTLI